MCLDVEERQKNKTSILSQSETVAVRESLTDASETTLTHILFDQRLLIPQTQTRDMHVDSLSSHT